MHEKPDQDGKVSLYRAINQTIEAPINRLNFCLTTASKFN
jgi:hypothetical protein